MQGKVDKQISEDMREYKLLVSPGLDALFKVPLKIAEGRILILNERGGLSLVRLLRANGFEITARSVVEAKE